MTTATPEKIAAYATPRSSAMANLITAYLSGAATVEETETAIRTLTPTNITTGPQDARPNPADPEYAEWYENVRDDALSTPSAGDYPDLQAAFMADLISQDDFGRFQNAYLGL